MKSCLKMDEESCRAGHGRELVEGKLSRSKHGGKIVASVHKDNLEAKITRKHPGDAQDESISHPGSRGSQQAHRMLPGHQETPRVAQETPPKTVRDTQQAAREPQQDLLHNA